MFFWDDLVYGVFGVIVFVDIWWIEDCFIFIDFFEECGLLFVVVVNYFVGEQCFDFEEVWEVL